MRDILLIIPAYNEEQSIVETVTAIRKFNRKRKRKVDFIVIDDGSTDRTAELLRLFHIPCIHMELNRGIGGAVQQGYRYAKATDTPKKRIINMRFNSTATVSMA